MSEDILIFKGRTIELSFFNYADGNIEIGIEDGEYKSFILNKEQINILLAWINHSREQAAIRMFKFNKDLAK